MSLFCLDTDPQCTSDAAISVLSNIYGYDFIHAFFTSGATAAEATPSGIAPVILGGLATIAGMLAIVMVITLTTTGLINSAQDGEALGKGTARYVVTARFLFSMILLCPTASGYCIAQIILMAFVLWSNGETNKLYNDVVSASTITTVNTSTTSSSLSTGVDAFGVRGFALAHFKQAFCLNLLNKNYSSTTYESVNTTSAISDYDVNDGISTAYTSSNPNEFGPLISDLRYIDPSDKAKGSYRVVSLVDKNAQIARGDAPVCGSMKITYLPTSPTDSTLVQSNGLGMSVEAQRSLYSAIASASNEISELKRAYLFRTTALVSSWIASSNIPFDLQSSDYATELSAVDFTGLRTIIESNVSDANSAYLSKVKSLNIKSLSQQLTTSLVGMGWTHAAGIKQRIISAQGQLTTSISNSVVTLTPPDLSVLDNDDTRLDRFKSAVEAMNIIVASTLGKATYAQAMDTTLIAQVVPTTLSKSTSVSGITAQLDDSYTTLLGSFRNKIIYSLITGSYSAGSAEAALTTTSSNWLDSDNDVLSNIQKTGEIISILLMSATAGLTVLKGAAFGLYSVVGVSSTLTNAAQGLIYVILDIIEPLMNKIIIYMGILAPYMSVILPSMPYFFFITGVVAWYIHILQAMAGIPFWSIMHMIPERSFVGSQTQGYVTVIALFLRPMLTLTGLFFGFLLANPILLFVTDAFVSMQGQMIATSSANSFTAFVTEMATFFNWLILYCTLMLQICYMIFGLAGTLPDTVLRWLGSGLNAGGWGESNAAQGLESASRGNATDTNMGRNSSGGGGNRGGGNGGGNNGVTPPSSVSMGDVSESVQKAGGPTSNQTPTRPGVDDSSFVKAEANVASAGISTPSSQSSAGSQGVTSQTSKASEKFQSLGGSVNASGVAKSYGELSEDNQFRDQSLRGNFVLGSNAAGVSGGLANIVKGIGGNLQDAKNAASSQSGFVNKIGASISSIGQGLANNARTGFNQSRDMAANRDFAINGGSRDSQGNTSRGAGNGVGAGKFIESYNSLKESKSK